MRRHPSHDLLANHCRAINGLGYIPFPKSGGVLQFHLISKLYEKTSVIIPANLEFGKWVSVFGPFRQICFANCLPGNGCQDDNRASRQSDASLLNHRDRQYILPVYSE
nr:ATP-binding protein [Parasedimentitalea psychrophila]